MSLAKVLVMWGHSRGIKIIAYLDNWLIHASDKDTLSKQMDARIVAARELGWVLNPQKSDWGNSAADCSRRP